MKKEIFHCILKMLAIVLFVSAIISCNPENKAEKKDNTNIISDKEIIPDTVVQFLITSAANDFRNHKPPTPVDFRNVKIGYLKSRNSEKTFIMCGEFLSQENNEWVEFATIKTSGYEQYLGKTQYCQDATMILTDEKLSLDLKNKLLKEEL